MTATYWVQLRPDGKWEVKTDGSVDPIVVTHTQNEAWGHATKHAREEGGWVFLRGRNGEIRQQRHFNRTA